MYKYLLFHHFVHSSSTLLAELIYHEKTWFNQTLQLQYITFASSSMTSARHQLRHYMINK